MPPPLLSRHEAAARRGLRGYDGREGGRGRQYRQASRADARSLAQGDVDAIAVAAVARLDRQRRARGHRPDQSYLHRFTAFTHSLAQSVSSIRLPAAVGQRGQQEHVCVLDYSYYTHHRQNVRYLVHLARRCFLPA